MELYFFIANRSKHPVCGYGKHRLFSYVCEQYNLD